MRTKIFLLAATLSGFINPLQGTSWQDINLPNQYVVPQTLSPNVYCTQLPTSPLVWTETSECNTYQPP